METLLIVLLVFMGMLNAHKIVLSFRDQRKVRLRPGLQQKIQKMIQELLQSGKLIDRNIGRELPWLYKVPYKAVLGAKFPKKVIFLQAGVHGLEYFSIQTLLIFIKLVNEDLLCRLGIRIIAIPIVNYWGFENYKRTNQKSVDLARDFHVYKSPLTDVPSYLFVRGYKMTPTIKQITILMGKTWYHRGDSQLQIETLEILNIVSDILIDNKKVALYDFHTGNNSRATTVWRSEFDMRTGIPSHLEKVFAHFNAIKKNSMHFASIDYTTLGGLFEGLSQIFKESHPNLDANTIELSVLEKADFWHYNYYYFFTTVFEPKKKNRARKLKEEVEKIQAIIDAEMRTEQLENEIESVSTTFTEVIYMSHKNTV
ncbi:MAG: hypothetical protein ACJAU8_000646 [Candidatus Paceibacteria bacterium]|jgi:hypothetical protein